MRAQMAAYREQDEARQQILEVERERLRLQKEVQDLEDERLRRAKEDWERDVEAKKRKAEDAERKAERERKMKARKEKEREREEREKVWAKEKEEKERKSKEAEKAVEKSKKGKKSSRLGWKRQRAASSDEEDVDYEFEGRKLPPKMMEMANLSHRHEVLSKDASSVVAFTMMARKYSSRLYRMGELPVSRSFQNIFFS